MIYTCGVCHPQIISDCLSNSRTSIFIGVFENVWVIYRFKLQAEVIQVLTLGPAWFTPCLNVLQCIRFCPWNLFHVLCLRGFDQTWIFWRFLHGSHKSWPRGRSPDLSKFVSIIKTKPTDFLSRAMKCKQALWNSFYWRAASLDSNSTFKRYNGFFFFFHVEFRLSSCWVLLPPWWRSRVVFLY